MRYTPRTAAGRLRLGVHAAALGAALVAPVACSDEEPVAPTGPRRSTIAPARGGSSTLPVNGRIVFASALTGDLEIYSVEPNGSDLRRLTYHPGPDAEPTVSSDGKKVAFVRDGEIHTMNADGSGVRRVTSVRTTLAADAFADTPAWSPNGRQIAFAAGFGGNVNIYTVGASGGAMRQLTDDVSTNRSPTWSPNGARIAFASDRAPFGRPNVHVMDADGSNVVQLTFCDECTSPAWSPDGTRMAYTGQATIGVLPVTVDGTPTGDAFDVTAAGNPGGAAWSPDGVSLAFAQAGGSDDGDYEIRTVVADGGSTPVAVTANSALDATPSWGRR